MSDIIHRGMKPVYPLRLFLTLFGVVVLVYLYLYTGISPAMAQSQFTLQQGIQAMKEGRINDALSLFRQATQEDPQSAQAYLFLGMTLHQIRQFKGAEDAYIKGIELDPNNPETKLRLGILYEDTGRLSEAEAAYKEVMQAASGAKLGEVAGMRLTRLEIRIHFDRAMGLSRKGKLQDAIAELEEVVRLDPKNAEVYFGIGEMYEGLKQWEQALRAYQKAVELNPAHLKANLRLGQYYEAQRDWEKAKESYEKIAAVGKEGSEAREAASRLEGVKKQIRINELIKEIYDNIDKNKREDALKGIETLLTIDPKNAMAYYFRGYVEDSQKRYQEAIQDITHAMELAPDYLPAPLKLGTVYLSVGEKDKAISLFKDVISRGRPDDDPVKRAQEWLSTTEASLAANKALEEAKASMERGEVEATQEALEEAVRLRPTYVQSYMALSILYAKNKQGEKALAILRKGVENNPNSPQAHLNLGLYLEQFGQLKEAESELRKVITLGKDTEDARKAEQHLKYVDAKQHFQEARRLMDEKEYESALVEIQKVIALFPDDASAYLSQGIIYDRLNKADEAIASLRKAIELNPKYVDPHLQMAMVLANMSKFEEARAEFEAALSLNPDEKTTKQIQSLLTDLEQAAKLYEYVRIARELFEKKKFEESLKETDSLIALRPSNYVAYFVRGLDLIELKRPLDAIDAFKKALESQPKALQPRLALGRIYMDEGRFEEAKEQFELVEKDGKGTREADFAAAALKRLRDISYSLSYSQAANSNLTKGTTGSVMDTSSSLNAGVGYIIFRNKQIRVVANGSASQTVYYKSQGLGNSYSGSISGQYRLGEEWALGGGINTGYGFFNNLKTSLTKGAFMSASMAGRGIPTGLGVQYSFLEAHSFLTPLSDVNRQVMSITVSHQLTPLNSISASYTFVTSVNLNTFGSNFAYRSNGVSTSYSRQITKDLSGYLGVNGNYFNYSNPDSVTLFQQFRKTTQYGLSAGLNYPLSELVNFGISYSYVSSTTNIKVSAKELQNITEILASPIPIVGGDYSGQTISINYSVSF